jgi:hypothetical protein
VAVRGKAHRVGPEFGQHRLGGAALDAWDRAQQLELTPERGESALDLLRELPIASSR